MITDKMLVEWFEELDASFLLLRCTGFPLFALDKRCTKIQSYNIPRHYTTTRILKPHCRSSLDHPCQCFP